MVNAKLSKSLDFNQQIKKKYIYIQQFSIATIFSGIKRICINNKITSCKKKPTRAMLTYWVLVN